VFVKIIASGLSGSNESVSVDLLKPEDLEALKQRGTGILHSFELYLLIERDHCCFGYLAGI
jgi:hypothetical protein